MKKINYSKIATKLNISHSAVSQWFSGKTKPTMDNAITIEKEFNIPLSAWKDIKSFISTDTITEDEKDKKVKREENLTKELQSA